MNKVPRIAFVGNPNCGKTTLFNTLSGANLKTSNFAGTSVALAKGKWKTKEGTYELIDLPGLVSMSPLSEEEALAKQLILDADRYDVLLYFFDATALKESLYLYGQLSSLNLPIIGVLTMSQVATEKGLKIDQGELAESLGLIIHDVDTRTAKGTDKLSRTIKNNAFGHHIDLGFGENEVSNQQVINTVFNQCVQTSKDPLGATKFLDKWVVHPVWGLLLFALIMFLIFQLVFSVAEGPMNWIDMGFSWLSEQVGLWLPEGMLNSFITDGVLAGLGGVVIFLPQIVFLFAAIGLLEESGYMSRVSFVCDKWMQKVGLNGKSIVPIVGGLACAVPSIMACRTIPNARERLLTMFVLPFMSCSARLPVYVLLLSLLVEKETYYGLFNAQGLLLFVLYIGGFIATVLLAYVANLFISRKEGSIFLMRMPYYKLPHLKSVTKNALAKGWIFLRDTGKIILVVTIVLWVLASFGPPSKRESIQQKYTELINQNPNNTEKLERMQSAELLNNSYMAALGKTIEPVLKPMGYDWKIGIGLVASLAAREVFVGTMATVYSLAGKEEEGTLLRDRMRYEKNDEGGPVFSTPVILSLLIFFGLAMQCFSTLAVLYKETGSVKWPLIQFLTMTGLAYFLSTVVYQMLA